LALAHITLATRNVEQSAAFFQDVLGWQRIARPGNIGVAAAWLEITAKCELHLVEVLEFEPSRFEREFGRHIAITWQRSRFPELKAQLEAHGATLIEPLRETPFTRFFFRDPNGYIFEVVEEEHDESRPIV